jgi:hypothetical protein
MKQYTHEDFEPHIICNFMHGSSVYKIKPTEYSDLDFITIVDDNIDLSEYPNKICELKDTLDLKEFPGSVTYEGESLNRDSIDFDTQYINESTFIDMVKKHHIIALESLWMPENCYKGKFDYIKYFTLDKWRLRQVISGIVNNSWAKCHKKLTVEKDYDFYRAIKSLFHCLRLYTFGIQIARDGKITDYTAANHYWEDLWDKDIVPSHKWEDYKAMYQPQLNALRSEFVKYCPKPIIKIISDDDENKN